MFETSVAPPAFSVAVEVTPPVLCVAFDVVPPALWAPPVATAFMAVGSDAHASTQETTPTLLNHPPSRSCARTTLRTMGIGVDVESIKLDFPCSPTPSSEQKCKSRPLHKGVEAPAVTRRQSLRRGIGGIVGDPGDRVTRCAPLGSRDWIHRRVPARPRVL